MYKHLTVVVYEFPAALHEIDSWENSKRDKIISKINLHSNIIVYTLQLDDAVETLVCYPSDIFLKLFKNDSNSQILSNDYLKFKALLFGKFNSNELSCISKIISKYEK